MKDRNGFVPEDFKQLFISCLAVLLPDSLMTISDKGGKRFNAGQFWTAWRRAFVNADYEVFLLTDICYFPYLQLRQLTNISYLPYLKLLLLADTYPTYNYDYLPISATYLFILLPEIRSKKAWGGGRVG